jgi:hypothetical protein
MTQVYMVYRSFVKWDSVSSGLKQHDAVGRGPGSMSLASECHGAGAHFPFVVTCPPIPIPTVCFV